MTTSINDPELGEIIFMNNIAIISEKAHVADFEALKKAYEIVANLNRELEQTKILLHESDSRNIYMGRLLAQTKDQIARQSFINFQNEVLYEIQMARI